MAQLEELAKTLTYSPELEEQRRWQNNLGSLLQKIKQTLRDRRFREKYLRNLSLMNILSRSIEIGKYKLRERELAKTHYKINPHYHSGYPFSHDAVRLRDPYLSAVKHMRKYRVRILYVTDHDNNLFFITLKNNPPESITKRFDIESDSWMITLVPKKSLLGMKKYHTLYIMNAREDHIIMRPGDKPLLNLEMIRPCQVAKPERARILPLQEFLEQAYPFATVNHPGLQGSFETEENVDRAFEVADVLRIPLFLEVFNGGVTPIQGYTNVWSEYYYERNPKIPVFTGSDLHRPDLRPAGVWVKKELLQPAMESRKGLEVNLAMSRALRSTIEGDVIQDKIYSEPFKVLYGYVGKKLVG